VASNAKFVCERKQIKVLLDRSWEGQCHQRKKGVSR